MKGNKIFLILFLLFSAAYIFGSILDKDLVVFVSNFLVIPALFMYYCRKTASFSIWVAIVLLAFYVRNIFMSIGFYNFPYVHFASFLVAILILLGFALGELRKPEGRVEETLSLLILYTFLVFLFMSLAEMVPTVVRGYEWWMYIYLFSLGLFTALSFTAYAFKSHYASLYLMLTGSAFLFSESSLFFKLFVLEDFSVLVFHPVFYIFSLFVLVQYGLKRRKNPSLTK